MINLSLEEEKKEISNEVIKAYLADEFFMCLKGYIDDEDYALAKDALKGLYLLAQKLELYNLYMTLVDLYEDIDGAFYSDIKGHYELMIEEYERLKRKYDHE